MQRSNKRTLRTFLLVDFSFAMTLLRTFHLVLLLYKTLLLHSWIMHNSRKKGKALWSKALQLKLKSLCLQRVFFGAHSALSTP